MERKAREKEAVVGSASWPRTDPHFWLVLRSTSSAVELSQTLRREFDEFRTALSAIRDELKRGIEISSSADRINGSLAARLPGLFPGRAEAQLPHANSSPGPEQHGVTLSARESQVLQLTADGQSRKEMAFALGISEKTVAFHKGNLKRKLGLQTTADLVRYVLKKAG